MITVVNIKTYRLSDYPGQHVYIGRAMPGRPGSVLGNPFKLRFECDRQKILAKYEYWLREKLQTDTPQRREIEMLAYLARDCDLALLCWCAPRLCHGDVVKRIVEERLAATFAERLAATQIDAPPGVAKAVNEKFWEVFEPIGKGE